MAAEAAVRGVRAPRAPIARWLLRDQRRSHVLWGVALTAVSAMYMAFYPSMANEDMEALMAGLPEALRVGMGWDAIATGAGYLQSTVYGLLAPALLLVFAVSHGARLLAGEEEAGTLELESTGPVARRSLLLQRLAVLAVGVVVLCAVLAAVTLVLAPALDMGIAPANILAAILGLWLFVLAMGTVTFAVGAVTGRRATALGVGAAIAVGSYMANAIAPMAEGAEWLETISPFSWYAAGEPLTSGVDPLGYALLLVLTVLAGAVAVSSFDRRDLGV